MTTGAFEGCYDEVESKHDIPPIVNIMAQISTVCWHKHPCRSRTDSCVVQKEKRRREINTSDFSSPSPVKKRLRRSSVGKSPNISKILELQGNGIEIPQDDDDRDIDLCCFLCNDRGEDDDPSDNGSNLHKAETFSFSKRVKDCSTKTNNFRLLAKIGSSDLIVLDAYYHLYCSIKLIRNAEGEDKAKEHDFDREIHLKELTFYELVEYVEEFR